MCPKLARICWGRSTGCFIYSFVIQVISEKRLCSKVLLAVWETLLHEHNCHYAYYWFGYKFVFILFYSFLANQKQEFGFSQVGGLVTRNIYDFCLYWVAVYFKAMQDSIDFYKAIFLHAIPVRIMVPWFHDFHCRCSFLCKTVSQFFEILILSQDIRGNVHYVPEMNLIS